MSLTSSFLPCSHLLQDVDGHVEVMILHGRSRVDSCQRRPNINHELVVEAPVIQIMADCPNKHGQAL